MLTFVVVGGGPTGVELAGAIAEMSRYTLARDFRHIDSKEARVILIESGERLLASFSPSQSALAARELESLGVQIWTKPHRYERRPGRRRRPERKRIQAAMRAVGRSA